MAKILITEDEIMIAMDLKLMLTERGHNVIGIAGEATEAFNLVLECKPDLIFMDINLRGKIDGIAIAQNIRKSSDVPIVFCSAYSSRKSIDEALSIATTRFITKPFSDNAIGYVLDKVL